ncbi:MAG: Holliday junction resolvase RuvX [Proteobacteria bacterium]|nr:Holliday junction resolvase RuvX [Pseudomonadota bacterium]
MPLRNPAELPANLPSGQRLLGLDVGSKTIGLALSDVTLTIASPLETLKRTRFGDDAERLVRLIEEFAVGALVIGLPINMDGSEGRRCQSVRAFTDNLMARIDIDICFWDERLSTLAAERMLIEADLSRRRRGQLIDKAAAAYILQGALDFIAKGAAGSDGDKP